MLAVHLREGKQEGIVREEMAGAGRINACVIWKSDGSCWIIWSSLPGKGFPHVFTSHEGISNVGIRFESHFCGVFHKPQGFCGDVSP